jgi:hypothetical protein
MQSGPATLAARRRGLHQALEPRWKRPEPAGSRDGTGSGQVHRNYPHATGTRPETRQEGITLSYGLFSFAYPPWLRAKIFRLIKSEMNISSS